MPNGPPNPWSESNSPSLRQNQGGSLKLIEQGNDSLTITSDGRPIAELRPIRRRTRTAPPPRHPVRRDPEFTAETARNNQRVLAQMMENSR